MRDCNHYWELLTGGNYGCTKCHKAVQPSQLIQDLSVTIGGHRNKEESMQDQITALQSENTHLKAQSELRGARLDKHEALFRDIVINFGSIKNHSVVSIVDAINNLRNQGGE